MTRSITLAEAIADVLRARGVRRMFGIPGGGSSLDLIEVAGQYGIDFVLVRTETAGAIMAAVTGELTGVPGVALAGVGPGAASAVNGVAYAALERAPMILFTDGPAPSLHQAFDQNEMFRPVTKVQTRLRPDCGRARLIALMDVACQLPRGPVQVDLTAEDAGTAVTGAKEPSVKNALEPMDANALDNARRLLRESHKPVIIAGMEARYAAADVALRHLADALACPVLLTYKAKGCFPDADPRMVGMVTGAIAEADCVGCADLIVLFGFDPVELFPGLWPYTAPVLDLYPGAKPANPIVSAVTLIAGLATAVEALVPNVPENDWSAGEIARLRRTMHARLKLAGHGHTAETVIEALAAAAPEGCRLTVDAGAHMISAMARWPASKPHDVLKSNGLSTMGFALPAAIAAALETPERPVAALTGDGGLMMCLAELTTAAAHGLKIVVVLLNDAALSLIDIKQRRRQHPSAGVRYRAVDFAGAAKALGCATWRVERDEPLAAVISEAFRVDGPALIDIAVDAGGYSEQLTALRG